MEKFYLLQEGIVLQEAELHNFFSKVQQEKGHKLPITILDIVKANNMNEAVKQLSGYNMIKFDMHLNVFDSNNCDNDIISIAKTKLTNIYFTPNKQLEHQLCFNNNYFRPKSCLSCKDVLECNHPNNKPQEVQTGKYARQVPIITHGRIDERPKMSAFSSIEFNMDNIYKELDDKLNQYNKQHSITKEEIDFYVNAHSIKIPESDELGNIRIDNLQMQLIMIYFKDKGINVRMVRKRDYINLMIILKKILLFKDMIFLPYVISGVVNIYEQKEINEEAIELLLTSFANRELNDFIKKYLFKLLRKKINIVDMNEDINNKLIDIKLPEMLYDELLIFLLLISEN